MKNHSYLCARNVQVHRTCETLVLKSASFKEVLASVMTRFGFATVELESIEF